MSEDDIERRLRSIDDRLKVIENKLQIKSVTITPFPDRVVTENKVNVTPTTTEDERPGNWLGIVAVICFILAAAFIIKLSIESGWLTPARQIGFVYLLGLSLIGSGFFLLKKDRLYASFLPAAGIIILYLATFSAHQYYALLGFSQAIGLSTLVSVLCVWLYCRIKHDIYAIIAALGTYLAPLILGFDVNATFALYYFVVCSLAFATISIWVQSRTLTMVAAYLAILVNGFIGLQLMQDRLVAIILPVHFVIFSVGSYFYSKKTGKYLTEKESWSFFPVLLLFYALEYYFVDRIHPTLAPYLSLLFAAFLFCLYLLGKNWFHEKNMPSEPMILAFVTLVVFHSFYLELLPQDFRPWLFVIIVLTAAMMPYHLANPNNVTRYHIPMLALLIVLMIEYVNMVSDLMNQSPHMPLTAVALVSLLSLWIFILRQTTLLHTKHELAYWTLGATHLLAIAALYHLTVDINSLAVSASWLFYAILVMGLAFWRKDKIMARSSVFVLSFAAGKALLYDAAAAPTVVRIVCLLLTGVVLYAAGFLLRKITDWSKDH